MAGRGFETARRTGTTVPRIRSIRYTTGQTFTARALVVETAGEIVECGANPAVVLGVALAGCNTYPGYDNANSAQVLVVTGTNQELPVAIADDEQEFSCRGVNGGTDPVVPALTDIDVQYGVVKSGTEWVLNQADLVNVVVVVTDIRIEDNAFLVKIIKSVRQE